MKKLLTLAIILSSTNIYGEVKACRPSALKILNVLKRWENDPLRVKKYVDKRRYDRLGGVYEIGYGFTSNGLYDIKRFAKAGWDWKYPKTMTEKQAHVFLTTAMIPAYDKIIDEVVKVPLTDNQRNALLLFTYNLGKSNLQKLVNGKGRLNSGNYESLRRLMPLYCNAKSKGGVLGLRNRRAFEVSLFYKK